MGEDIKGAAAKPTVAELPVRLKEVVSAEAAAFAAEVSGVDVNDIFMVEPSISDLQSLIGGAATDAPLLIRAYVRKEDRSQVFTTEQIEGHPYKKFLDIYAESLVQYHAAVKEITQGAVGKKIQAAPQLLAKDSS